MLVSGTKRIDMFVGVTKRLAGKLDPRVRRETVRSPRPDAHPDEGRLGCPSLQHSREGDSSERGTVDGTRQIWRHG
jgi:hypothetical protein